MLSRPLKYNLLKWQNLRSSLLTINEAGCFLKKCETEINSTFSDPLDKELKDRLHYFSCLFWLHATTRRSGVLGIWAKLQLQNTCIEDEVIRLGVARNYQQVLGLFLSFNDTLPAFQSLPGQLAELSAWAKGDYFSIFAAAYQGLEKFIAAAWQWRQDGYLFIDFLNIGSNPAYQQELLRYAQQGFKLLNVRQLLINAMQPLENCRFQRRLSGNQLILAACEEAKQEINLNGLGKKFRAFLTSPPTDQEMTDFFSWRLEEQTQKAQMAAELLRKDLRKKMEELVNRIFDGRFTEAELQADLGEQFYSHATILWGLRSSEMLKLKVAEVISKQARLKNDYPEGGKEDFPGLDYQAKFLTAKECARQYFLSALQEQGPHFETIEAFLRAAEQEDLDLQYFLRRKRLLSKIECLSAQLMTESPKDQEALKSDLSLLGSNKDTRITYWAQVLLLIDMNEKVKFKQEEKTEPAFFSKKPVKKEPFITLESILNLKSADYSLSELMDEYDKELSLELRGQEKCDLQALIKKLNSLGQSIQDVSVSKGSDGIRLTVG